MLSKSTLCFLIVIIRIAIVSCPLFDLRQIALECTTGTNHEKWTIFDYLYCPSPAIVPITVTNIFCHTRVAEERICACWAIPEWKVNGSEVTSLHYEQLTLDGYNHSSGYYKLQIARENISNLPDVMCNVSVVVEIDASFNKFETFGDFKKENCLSNLDSLNLSHNLIQVIERGALKELIKLRNFDISFNNIYDVEPYALYTGSSSQIMWADVSHNNLTEIDITNTFFPKSFCSLSYANNKIAKITNNLDFSLATFATDAVGYIDLANNNFEYVPDARTFGLSSMTDFGSFLFTKYSLQLENNPFVCDCNVVEIIKAASISLRGIRNLAVDHGLRCHSPSNMRDVMFNEIALLESTLDRFICNYSSCPPSCECYFQLSKMKVVLNCANKDLFQMLDLNLKELETRLIYSDVERKYEKSTIEVQFQHNSISRLSSNLSYLEKISLLNLSFNNLIDIDPYILLMIPKDAVIDLRSNPMLKMLPKEIATFEPSKVNISFLTLDCTCEDEMYKWLPNWIKASREYKQLDVYCVINGERVPASDLSSDRLGCTDFTLLYIFTAVIVVIVFSGGIIVYFRYELHLLYRQKRQTGIVNRIYKYHIYIAYDDQHPLLSAWIAKKFCPNLEARGYHVYLPSRDTEPGMPKEEEIRGAIEKSQNVVFFLTIDFVSGKDLWMMIEYSAAWHTCKEDLSRKIILVNYERIKRRDIIQGSLRAVFNVGILLPFQDDVVTKLCRYLAPPARDGDIEMREDVL